MGEDVVMPNIDEGARAWELGLAARVGTAVQARRKTLGLTAVQLAERTKQLGYPITRVAITKIEGNSRSGKLDVAELSVLAAALDVAPLELLFPGEADSPVERLPDKTVPTAHAASWFADRPDWLDSLHGAVDQLTQVLRPGGIPPSEQFGAITVTKEDPPAVDDGEKVALGAIAHTGETR
jgi:transcriptional regulator with XRE-family HTH domain